MTTQPSPTPYDDNIKPRKRRKRRPTQEIISLLIDAAREEFQLHGYDKATTAAIAKRAGVTEALLFKHFGSKANLFHDTVFKPMDQHFDEFRARNQPFPDDAPSRKEGARQYVRELQEFLGQHSKIFLSLAFAQSFSPNSKWSEVGIKHIQAYFDKATTAASPEDADIKSEQALMSRISFAAILAPIIFKDWLFPDGLASEVEIENAINNFVMHGLNHRYSKGQPDEEH